MLASRTPVTCAQIAARFPTLFSEVIGDGQRTVQAVVSPDQATSTDLVFLSTPKALATGLNSQAQALVIGAKAKDQVLTSPDVRLNDRTVLVSPNPELAMAKVISEFFMPTPYTNASVSDIHPTAIIGNGAQIAPGVRVGPGAFIGANVKIGFGSYVGTNSVIEDASVIGEMTVIHPLVFIGHSTVIGNRCEIHPQTVVGKEGFGYAHDERFNHTRIPHQGKVVLEDDVHIGSSCTIDRATFGETRIQAGARLDNQVHIGHNCKIGKNSLFTACIVVAGSTTIGANFVAGGMTAITGHITLADNIQLAGMSAVTKSLDQPGQYGGNPLLPLPQFLKMKAAQAQLAEMRTTVKKIVKHLGLSGDD